MAIIYRSSLNRPLTHAEMDANFAELENITSSFNSFTTIQVTGQSDVVADSVGDVVAFVAGTGMLISTNAAQDTITFTVAGAGQSTSVPTDFKDSVLVATTANITLSGEQTIDGVLTSSSRVLVKNQTTASQNGIYVSAAGAWSRATDADASDEISAGMMVLVEQGTVSAGLIYICTNTGTIDIGTTSITFAAISLPTTYFPVKSVTGTSYTTVLLDSGKRLLCSNAGTKTITIPPQSSVVYAVNTEIEIQNTGAGLLTVAAGSGVTINALGGILTVPQWHCVKLKKTANANTWTMTGIGLAAAPVSTSRTITSGAGLTGGGDLSSDRTLAVGAGTGITVNADDVALNVNGLSEDTSPDAAADFLVTYDNSASTHKKVKPQNLRTTESLIIACSDETTALTTGTAKVTFRMPYAFTLTDVRASVTTAPTGASLLTVDVNEGGTTILSTKLTFDASEKTTTTAATPRVISDTSLADDAEITIDIDQVGSTIAGAGLKVYLIGYRT